MRYLKVITDTFKEIFDDRITRSAGIVFVLILGFVIFDIASGVPEKYPLPGVFLYGMVPVLFIAGGIIFVLALWRS